MDTTGVAQGQKVGIADRRGAPKLGLGGLQFIRWISTLIISFASLGVAQSNIQVDQLGTRHTLQKLLQDRPAIVYIWATWCAPCREELPRIQQFRQEHKVRIIGLHLGGDWKGIQAYLERENLQGLETYRISTSEARKLKLPGVPTSFVFGSNTKVLKTHYGPLSWAALEKLYTLTQSR